MPANAVTQAHDSHAGPRTADTDPRTADAGPQQLTQAYSNSQGTGYGFLTYGDS